MSVRVRIDGLRVTAGSAIEARRLAEALPAALDRAFARWPEVPALPRHASAADRVAVQVVARAVAARSGEGGR